MEQLPTLIRVAEEHEEAKGMVAFRANCVCGFARVKLLVITTVGMLIRSLPSHAKLHDATTYFNPLKQTCTQHLPSHQVGNVGFSRSACL